MKVIARQYSKYYDLQTGVQFEEILDRLSGTYVGFADVSEQQASKFQGREHFELVSDEVFAARTEFNRPAEPQEPNTGDPIADLVKQQGIPQVPPIIGPDAEGALTSLGLGAPPPPPSK